MEFGVQFFPDVEPRQKSGSQYFQEALTVAKEADKIGFTHIRIVEHYFHYYGGYSPNPMLFLAAAAQRTRQARLVTGAVLPVFNHPLKLAGEIGMLDAISEGRLDVGFARAFLPHEFRRFGISPNESVARFREGLDREVPCQPGELYRVEVDLWSTAHAFLPGHRLRLQVCASDFPRYDRCPGTGETVRGAIR